MSRHALLLLFLLARAAALAGCVLLSCRPEAGPPGKGATAAPGIAEDPGSPDREPAIGSDLLAIPYLSGYRPAGTAAHVTVREPGAQEGWNLYLSGHAAEAFLIDMDGNELHRWQYPLAQVWPDAPPSSDHFRRAHLDEEGRLLAIYEGVGIIRIDRDSRLIWAWRGGCHHDLDVTEDGRIHVLVREARLLPEIHPVEPILEDFIAVLSPAGELLEKVSILQALARSPYASWLERAARKGDIFHTNTIQWLDGRHAERHAAFRKGNYLVSIPYLDAIAVVDPRDRKIVWGLHGMPEGLFRMQHDPLLLPNGNVLVFDNMGRDGASKVLEFEPLTRKRVWEYTGSAERPFESIRLGANQRLPNGNTLIVDSMRGTALEVTRDLTVVWEFVNPHRGGHGAELLEQFRLDATRNRDRWDPARVEEVERVLAESGGEDLTATLLDLIRIPPGRVDWLDGD